MYGCKEEAAGLAAKQLSRQLLGHARKVLALQPTTSWRGGAGKEHVSSGAECMPTHRLVEGNERGCSQRSAAPAMHPSHQQPTKPLVGWNTAPQSRTKQLPQRAWCCAYSSSSLDGWREPSAPASVPAPYAEPPRTSLTSNRPAPASTRVRRAALGVGGQQLGCGGFPAQRRGASGARRSPPEIYHNSPKL